MKGLSAMSDYITTFTGKHFYPMSPDPMAICIEDIAHALSLICRGNGHVHKFWSVAEHCICCAKEAEARGLSARVILACLLHDASECYMSDVPRPFKKEMDAYQEQEENLLSTIYEKFLGSDLTEKEQAQVCDIDDVMLWYDLENLLEEKQDDDMPGVNIKLDYIVRPFETVEQEYNRLFAKYFNIVKGLEKYGKWFKDAWEYNSYLATCDKVKKSSVHFESINDLPNDWTGIETAYIAGRDTELIKSIPSILKMAHDLKKISITQYCFGWEELCRLNLANIEALHVTVNGMAYAPKLNLPNLKELELFYSEEKWSDSIEKKYEEHMDYSGLCNLRRLELRNVPDAVPEDFAQLRKLESLRLTYNYGDDLSWLKNARYQLKTLIIDNGVEDCEGLRCQKNIEDLQFFYHHITDVSPIEELTKIKKLDLGRNLIENEGNLREMGIEWIQITRRDYDVRRIYNEVEQIAQLAVKEDRKRIQYYEENKVKSICWQKASLEAFLSNPFAERIKILIKEICHQRIEKLHTQEGEKEIDSRYGKALTTEEYIQCFKQKIVEYYPFLTESRGD